MPDESDPPRKIYGLKPRAFEAVNELPKAPEPVASGEPAGHSVPDPGRIDVRDIYRQAGIAGPILAKGARPGERNDVHAILDENLRRANAAGLNDLTPKVARKSRRKRDYWLLMICACGFFGTVAIKAGPHNVVPFAYGLAGLIVSIFGLTWVMWFVMDDY